MIHGPPRANEPELIRANHPRAELPEANLALDFGKTSDNLTHYRTLCWIFLDHVVDEWCQELEPMVFLALGSQNSVSKGGKKNGSVDTII